MYTSDSDDELRKTRTLNAAFIMCFAQSEMPFDLVIKYLVKHTRDIVFW